MATQDRNIERNAEVARKYLVAAAAGPGATDKDLIRHLFGPRHNFRITDLEFYAEVVATAAARNRICIAKELSAVGAPQFTGAAAVTFAIEAFDQLDAGVFVTVAATAAQAFTGTEVVSDGFFGVWTVQIDGAQAITTKAAAGVMAFLTAADALRNAPKPDALNGLVGVLILEASGGDFTAGTTNTNAALVNTFDTIDRGGIFVDVAISALESLSLADLDLAANRRLTVARVGNLVGVDGDLLVLTTRSAGAPVFTDGAITGGYRKFPLQGESGPDVATGLSAPQVI
jgi:hypothetical protein